MSSLSRYSVLLVSKVNHITHGSNSVGTYVNSTSSAAKALLKDGTFTPRALTRDPTSDAALKLKESGAEVVQASSSLFSGRDILARFSLRSETVPSSLPSITKMSGGKYTSVTASDGKFGTLRKTPTGFAIAIPNYSPTARSCLTWVGNNVGVSVLALLKSYTDPSKNVSGKAYPVLAAIGTYPELAALIAKALGVEVTFATAPLSGMKFIDDMYTAISENNGLYPDAPVLNPDLLALGATFGTIEEFLEKEIKPRFGQQGGN
ncbi:hypothetical protein C8R44DRAFT_742564 [Mycena epipterygia]|nr:hypothetical protein C8R44DRAFT_742564 [Mycena epipterygia]